LFFSKFFVIFSFLGDAEEEKLRRQQNRISQRARMNRDGTALGGSGGLRVS
jgi:hypothetical protein